MNRHLPIYTNSSLNTFRRCAREYYFRYVLLRKTRSVTEVLRFGSFFHFGLNAWWREPGDGLAKCIAAHDAIRERAHLNREDADPFELAKAEELLVGYTVRWGDEPYETLAVEKQFHLPIASRYYGSLPIKSGELAGAIDALVYRKSGPYRTTTHIVESKTTGSDISPGSDYWRHVVTMDPQVSTYMSAATELGFNPRDTVYDVIRKPEIRPQKATPEEDRKYTKPTKLEPIPRLYKTMREADETPGEFRDRLRADIIERPEWYFRRMTIVRLDRDNAEHARDVALAVESIQFAKSRDAWPRSPNACERYRRLCEFHDVCSGITTIDDDVRFKTKTKQHEELADDESAG